MMNNILTWVLIGMSLILLSGCAMERQDIPEVDITVSVYYSSMGTVTGSGTYNVNSQVILTATPNPGYQFVRWDDYSTDATRTITAPSSSTSYTAYFEAGIERTMFSENFDASDWQTNSTSYAGTWNTSTYDDWPWDRTTTKAFSGSYSAGAQGPRTTYTDNTYSELKRTVNLSGFSSATLNFMLSTNTEQSYDTLEVRVLRDSSITTVATYSGSTNWVARTVNLNAYVGQTITLIFRFSSDSSMISSGAAGVWLDDIVLSAR